MIIPDYYKHGPVDLCLYARYLCSRAHSASPGARDDRVSCIQDLGMMLNLIEIKLKSSLII